MGLLVLGFGLGRVGAGHDEGIQTITLVGGAALLMAGSFVHGGNKPSPSQAGREHAARPLDPGALEEVLAPLSEGVVLLDPDGRLLAANSVAREMLSLPSGNGTAATLAKVDWPQLAQAVQASRQSGMQQTFEGPWGEDSQARILEVTVRTKAKDAVAVVVLRDHSRLRQLESHRRDFVANVSHELKTPLAAIQGFVETMLDDAEMPDATRLRFLQKVQRQAHRLATLVQDLLTLSRLDERMPEQAQAVDLVGVAQEVLRDLAPLVQRRQLEMRAELPKAAVWIAAEREALRQVLSNLVDNAVKYTPEGGRVSLSLSSDGATIRFAVQDTGIGLSESDQERVFERFYRVDKARSRELGGTGLGLSIVKNTVASLGGEVGVESELGKGSTFWVLLPQLQHLGEAQPSDSE